MSFYRQSLTFLGAVLLVVGTSLGGGMLALPVAIASLGLPLALMYLFLIWAVMTYAALLILEINLTLPSGSNLISMARITLGRPGELVAWITYLSLLYVLLSAYLAGGSDIVQNLASQQGFIISSGFAAVVFLLVMGFIIVSGLAAVEQANAFLMMAKLFIFVFLIAGLLPHIKSEYLWVPGHLDPTPVGVLITAFGYAIVIPSLRPLFHEAPLRLKNAVVAGSFVPLICYVLWCTAILGVLPAHGDHSLQALARTDHVPTQLAQLLAKELQQPLLTWFFRLFIALSMLTTFLGVGLSLVDFLADGTGINKQSRRGVAVYLMAFLPPLFITWLYPGAFLFAIRFAGIWVVLLLIGLPLCMAWKARRQPDWHPVWQAPGGQAAVWVSLLAAILLLGITVMYCF